MNITIVNFSKHLIKNSYLFLKIQRRTQNDRNFNYLKRTGTSLSRFYSIAIKTNENTQLKVTKTHTSKYVKPLNSDQEKASVVKDSVVEVAPTETGQFKYKKLKSDDPKISSLMLLVKSKKRRNQHNFILLEGKRLIRDGLLAGCEPHTLLFSRIEDLHFLKNILPMSKVSLYQISLRDLQIWSELTTCPGVMAIVKTPEKPKGLPSTNDLPLTVVADNIRDPGNLGAVIRSLAAVGCQKLLLTKGCVDMWDTKVLRSAAGAHFKLIIESQMNWYEIKNQLNPTSGVFIADNNIQELSLNQSDQNKLIEMPIMPYSTINYKQLSSIMLIIGGETEGISSDAYKLVQDTGGCRIHIPLMNNIDSLNTGTALAIISFEIRRQLFDCNQT